MSAKNFQGQKKGNNTLFFILGILLFILIGLFFLGKTRESQINQLIEAAAPDSSNFNPDMVSSPTVENQIAETPVAKSPEIKTKKTDTVSKVDPVSVSEEEKPEAKIESAEGILYTIYKIRKGDTMYKIAAKFGNKAAEVMELNDLADMSVQADKEIKLKIKAVHEVKDGEGMNAVVEKYSIPAKSILLANDLTSENLSSGTKLLIPLK